MKKNQYYIVRTGRAGVFFGQIKSKTETSVVMTDVRKLFSWSGAAAVEQLAEDGTANPNGCKFTISVQEMELSNWLQIIPCTEKAETSIKAVKEWKI